MKNNICDFCDNIITNLDYNLCDNCYSSVREKFKQENIQITDKNIRGFVDEFKRNMEKIAKKEIQKEINKFNKFIDKINKK